MVNQILLTEDDRLDGDVFLVAGRRAAHILSVLRPEPGRELRVGLLEGPRGMGRVIRVGTHTVKLDCVFEAIVPQRPPVDLLLAVPRPKELSRLLPEITALGVDRIVLMRTWRVAKPYLAATILDPAVHRPLLHEGLMLSRRTREPRVRVEPLFRPYVEDRAAAEFEGATRLVAHPGAGTLLADLSFAPDERVVLAVGPEGGFIPFEIDLLGKAGFRTVNLGPDPLRVATATVALLAVVGALRRR